MSSFTKNNITEYADEKFGDWSGMWDRSQSSPAFSRHHYIFSFPEAPWTQIFGPCEGFGAGAWLIKLLAIDDQLNF